VSNRRGRLSVGPVPLVKVEYFFFFFCFFLFFLFFFFPMCACREALPKRRPGGNSQQALHSGGIGCAAFASCRLQRRVVRIRHVIRIGSAAPLTGEIAHLQIQLKWGQMAVDDINASGISSATIRTG